MSTQTLAVVVDVPDDQQTAAQAAAAAFVTDLPGNVDGATVLSATFGGVSLLPSARDRMETARAAFDALAAQNTIKPSDLKAALADLDAATAAYELSLAADLTPPAVQSVPVVTVDGAVAAATLPAPTGEEDAVAVQAGQPAVPAAS